MRVHDGAVDFHPDGCWLLFLRRVLLGSQICTAFLIFSRADATTGWHWFSVVSTFFCRLENVCHVKLLLFTTRTFPFGRRNKSLAMCNHHPLVRQLRVFELKGFCFFLANFWRWIHSGAGTSYNSSSLKCFPSKRSFFVQRTLGSLLPSNTPKKISEKEKHLNQTIIFRFDSLISRGVASGKDQWSDHRAKLPPSFSPPGSGRFSERQYQQLHPNKDARARQEQDAILKHGLLAPEPHEWIYLSVFFLPVFGKHTIIFFWKGRKLEGINMVPFLAQQMI